VYVASNNTPRGCRCCRSTPCSPWPKKPAPNAQEAKKLADKFQEDVVAVMLSRNDLDAENKVIADKALDGTKPKKRTNKPSNFVTNDEFYVLSCV
jgi:hypothetical protein